MAKSPDLEKLLKEGLIKYGSDPSLVINRTSSGIEKLDELLGGGLPLGKIIELYGPESTGKTLICQYIAAAIQKTDLPGVLYMDMEDSFDQGWWAQSDVDLSRMMVSNPATGEGAIDIMMALLQAKDAKLGLIIVDSIAAMTPSVQADPDKSSEDKGAMGVQAKLITLMFHKIKGLLGDCIFLLTNQMRDSLGTMHDEIGALPGGRANRHYCHAILRTRRESWINEGDNHVGFNMEIINKKNKLAKTADGASIILPFNYRGQIDVLMSYMDEAINLNIIQQSGPWYQFAEQKWLGKSAMREAFSGSPNMTEKLKTDLATVLKN